ncbi:MAG: Na(+)/H(+) antiporter subunit D [Alphaproteobacteria bacterium]
MISLHPTVIFLIGGVLAGLVGRRAAGIIVLLTPALGMANLLYLDAEMTWQVDFLEYQLDLFRADKLALLFGYLFHIAAFIGALFSLHLRDRIQQAAAMLYAGSAIGAVFAGDLITFFLFWELAAVTSVFLIWARRTKRAMAAGMRYLIIQVVSGLLFFTGVLLLIQESGSIAFDYIGLDGPASWLILIALGIKCGFPLAHNWLTDAYPEATPTGTVFLSAFTTKVAVYALARAYPGTELLVYVGAAMTVFPIFYAVIENDLRRVLCYSMINQIGFMVCGIGIGTALAMNGAISHAFNDVIFKGLLFMTMGSVLHMTGRMNGSDLGGLYKSMPMTTVFCIVGAASISAFPLFSGFVSKSMVMVAALEEGYSSVWLMLLFASAGVFHHAGIKIPYFAFFAHDAGIRTSDPPLNMRAAMAIGAVLCIAIGSYPAALYALLPFPVEYEPFTAGHVLAQVQLLFFGALAFVWLNLTGLYPPELKSVNLDVEWLYRRLAPRLAMAVGGFIGRADHALRRVVLDGLDAAVSSVRRYVGAQGALTTSLSTGAATLWVAVLLGIFLVIYYARS